MQGILVWNRIDLSIRKNKKGLRWLINLKSRRVSGIRYLSGKGGIVLFIYEYGFLVTLCLCIGSKWICIYFVYFRLQKSHSTDQTTHILLSGQVKYYFVEIAEKTPKVISRDKDSVNSQVNISSKKCCT